MTIKKRKEGERKKKFKTTLAKRRKGVIVKTYPIDRTGWWRDRCGGR
jgi:hypothetical protein